MSVDVAHTRAELTHLRNAMRGTVALVPTMGALHEGHRTLMQRARHIADDVIVSIFVNPLQFGPGEDLDRYPRAVEADLAMCADEGVRAAFMPTAAVMYPSPPVVRICAGELGARYEGAIRPGHFDGVLTVVAKLFALVRPDIAVFGRKDAQQLALVRRMVADLDLGVHIEAAPLVRDADGLALSSRNRYLSKAERETALTLPTALAAGSVAAGKGATASQIVAATTQVIEATGGVVLDYVVLVDADTFAPIGDDEQAQGAVLAVAGRVGTTRLIDNVLVDVGVDGVDRVGDGVVDIGKG